MDRPAIRDGALLVIRVILGAIFALEAVRVLIVDGPAEPARTLEEAGVFSPTAMAWTSAVVLVLGSLLLITGLLTTLVAAILAAGVAVTVAVLGLPEGIFDAAAALEFPVLLIASLLVIVVFGPGRVSWDGALNR